MNNTDKLSNNLQRNLDLLKKSLIVFSQTHTEVERIINSNNVSFEEDILKEAFVARFSRTLDIFTQKVLKNFCLIMQENLPTFIDRANFLEKLKIIPSASELKELRMLRNEIAHEYQEENLAEIAKQAFTAKPVLENIIIKLEEYINEKAILGIN